MLAGRVTVFTGMTTGRGQHSPQGLHCEPRLLREVATGTSSAPMANVYTEPKQADICQSPGRCVCSASVSVPHTRDSAHLVCAGCVLTFGLWDLCSRVRYIWTRSMGCAGTVSSFVPGHVLVYLCMPEGPGEDSMGSVVVVTALPRECPCWLLFFCCLCVCASRRRAECTVLLVMVCDDAVTIHPGAALPGQDCVFSGYIQSVSLRGPSPGCPGMYSVDRS